MFEKRFLKRLEIQEQEGLYRNPPEIEHREGRYIVSGKRRLLNFSSNDYLGLGTSEEFSEKTAYNFRKYDRPGSYPVIIQSSGRRKRGLLNTSDMRIPCFSQADIRRISGFFPLFSNPEIN